MLTKEDKIDIIKDYAKTSDDTGSTEVQIALLTARIKYLTEHFKQQPKDFASRRGLLKLVGQRRSFLVYLKSMDSVRYVDITKRLGIRK
ncbi:30S ribosomal protein S15 [Deltaproteobacteria bacterium TL4]